MNFWRCWNLLDCKKCGNGNFRYRLFDLEIWVYVYNLKFCWIGVILFEDYICLIIEGVLVFIIVFFGFFYDFFT